MALKLVTGPANAAKAGRVLGEYRRLADAGEAPLLVVPTSGDRYAYESELLADGALVGGRVLTWEALVGLFARTFGSDLRLVGPLRRRTLIRKAIDRAAPSLNSLAGSAITSGFVSTVERAFRELGRAGLDATRFAELEATSTDPRRVDLAQLFSAYEQELTTAKATDRERQALAVLGQMETGEWEWDGRPVLVYGFSELTVVQRRTLTALSQRCEVLVSLPADGRAKVGLAENTMLAFARSEQEGVIREILPAQREPEGPGLLESLMFTGAGRGAAVEAANSVRVVAGSGTIAAAELVAAEVAESHRGGVAVDQLVIVRPQGVGTEPIVAALRDRGFESSCQVVVELSSTVLGAALIGFLRCQLDRDHATGAHASAWLKAMADEDGRDLVDSIDRRLRAKGERRASRLLGDWRKALGEPPLTGDVGDLTPKHLLAGEVKTAARKIFAALVNGVDGALTVDQAEHAAALSAVTIGMGDLIDLYEPGSAQAMIDELAALPVQLSDGAARSGAVLISDALSIRGRSFETVIVCGLEDGVFPASFSPDPFLEDAAAEGLELAPEDRRLSASEAHSAGEREKFAICAARARSRLVLVRRSKDDSGSEVARSGFLDEAMILLGHDDPEFTHEQRRAGDVRSDGGPREALRLAARDSDQRSIAPTPPSALGAAASAAIADGIAGFASPTRLEKWAECPAKWLAEVVLSPADFEELPEAMELGNVIHAALEAGIGDLIRHGAGPVNQQSRQVIDQGFQRSLAESAERAGESPTARLRIALAGRLVEIWLENEIARADGWIPREVEFAFGRSEGVEPFDLGGGLVVTGSIDRVDVATDADGNEFVVIRDYKSGSSPDGDRGYGNGHNRRARKWMSDDRPVFQAPLYLKAASERLGLKPGGAFYETLRDNVREGGLISGLGSSVGFKEMLSQEELERLIDESVERAGQAVSQMLQGAVAPSDSCACPHPWLCGRNP